MIVFNSLALENNFNYMYRNTFQNGVNSVKIVIKKKNVFLFFVFVCLFFVCFVFLFVKKLKTSCSSDHTILFNFHWHVVQTFLRNVWRDFRLPMSALATLARKSFKGKFKLLQKLIFRSGILYYHC